MAAGTVGYTDTRGGDRDYLGGIAKSIGNRIKQASDMAREERAFASKQAEMNNTSLEEAGIGKGHFFKRALGSRFGGDRIARTRGRFESDPPAGRDPTKNYKQRFRGGFDYKYSEVINQVTNQTSQAIVPMSSAITGGMRAVQVSVDNVAQALVRVGDGMSDLATSQADMARNIMMNGAFQQAFMQYIMRQQSRMGARREERSIERGRVGRLSGGDVKGLLTGKGFGGSGGPLAKGGFNMMDAISFLSGRTGAINQFGSKATRAAVQSTQMGIRSAVTGGRAGASAISAMSSPITRIGKNPIPKKLVTTGGAKAGRTIANTIAKKANPEAVKAVSNIVKHPKRAKTAGKKALKLGGRNLDLLRSISTSGLLSEGGTIYVSDPLFDDASRALVNVDKIDEGTDVARGIAKLADSGADTKTIANIVQKSPAGKKALTKGLTRGGSAARMLAKAGGKSLLKKIPVVAGLAGVAFGIGRLFENPPDFLGAGLEIASGLMGATGVGAGASLALDGFLLARDMGAVPFAKGGLLTGKQPVNALMGEAGPEIVTPLNDQTFMKFGQGIIDAQKKNKSQFAKIQAAGLSEYYEKQGGWEQFGESFKGIFDDLKDKIGGIFQGLNPGNWRFPNPFAGNGNGPGGGDRPGATAGSETLDIGEGGGQLQGLSDEDYIQIAKTIAGEAGPGDDQYLVAGAILNRVASAKFPNTVTDVVTAGQGTAHPQFEGYLANANVEDIVKRLKSPEGQARLVASLQRLEGRTDFKGQTQLHNRVAGADPMFDKKGNFAHYYYETGPNSVRPSDYVAPDFSRFIKRDNTSSTTPGPGVSGLTPSAADMEWYRKKMGDTSSLSPQMSPLSSANKLQTQSMFATTAMTLPPIINNVNNYYGGQQQMGDTDTFAGGAFENSGLTAFALPYSIYSKT